MDIKPYLAHPEFRGLSLHPTHNRAVEAAREFAVKHGGKVCHATSIVSFPNGARVNFMGIRSDLRMRLMGHTFQYVVAEPGVPFGEVVYARILLRKPLEGLPNVLVAKQ